MAPPHPPPPCPLPPSGGRGCSTGRRGSESLLQSAKTLRVLEKRGGSPIPRSGNGQQAQDRPGRRGEGDGFEVLRAGSSRGHRTRRHRPTPVGLLSLQQEIDGTSHFRVASTLSLPAKS